MLQIFLSLKKVIDKSNQFRDLQQPAGDMYVSNKTFELACTKWHDVTQHQSATTGELNDQDEDLKPISWTDIVTYHNQRKDKDLSSDSAAACLLVSERQLEKLKQK